MEPTVRQMCDGDWMTKRIARGDTLRIFTLADVDTEGEDNDGTQTQWLPRRNRGPR